MIAGRDAAYKRLPLAIAMRVGLGVAFSFIMIHIALVGCGGFGGQHAGKLKDSKECRVIAVCDPVAEKTAKFKKEFFPEAVEVADYGTLLKNPPARLDAVILATPHALHYPQIKAALLAGVHVLTEKPMVTSSPHAYDLWKTVKQTGKLLAISFQAPYSAEYQYLRTLRDDGRWGRVQIVQGWLAQGWKQLCAGSWRQDPAVSGGGQMYDSGSHVLNGMMWLMNEPVIEVSCFTDNSGTPVDINGVAILKFRSGALGTVGIGGNSPGWNVDIRVQAEKLQFRTGPHGGYLDITGNAEFKYPAVPTSPDPIAWTPHENFFAAIRGEAELIAPVRYGVLLSALMDAMYESATKGCLVKVAPVPDEI